MLVTPSVKPEFEETRIFHHLQYAWFARKDLLDHTNTSPMSPLLQATVSPMGPPIVQDFDIPDISKTWIKAVRRVVFYIDLGWDEDMNEILEYVQSKRIKHVMRWIGKESEKIK